MECSECGAKNRETARFCDNCGMDMVGGQRDSPQLERSRLQSMMGLDWLLRFVSIAVLGSAMGIISFLLGEPVFALLFIFMGLFGWVCTIYMLSHR